MHAVIFFVSSAGDTDLAKATIESMTRQKFAQAIYLAPLTNVAAEKTLGFNLAQRVTLAEITGQTEILSKKSIESEDLIKLSSFIETHDIQRAYIGIPSPIDEEIPYQIAEHLTIPCVIAYEYMFKPSTTHSLWKHLPALQNKEFAIPLKSAISDISITEHVKTHLIGHLSIDRALNNIPIQDSKNVKAFLNVHEEEKLVFVSGTTQPIEIDNAFVKNLLTELNTGCYPKLQIRFGLHPGIRDINIYLKSLLATCEQYPKAARQFKIILPPNIEQKLQIEVISHINILRKDVSGATAAAAADNIAQAVPGALLNEAAIKGVPSYYHDKQAEPYLPKSWFSDNLSAFFKAEPQARHSRKELDLSEVDCPTMLAKTMHH
ncbi:MAG: Uncharacterized protein K0S08_1078 [Gammaproteobacteria bacterium]|jgi:hypothetical protein|nr:Uncharacterized protein [Gammaproteobacteria bacterium]